MSAPRSLRSSSSVRPRSSWPLKRIWPFETLPFGPRKFTIEKATVLLPQPDSPTRPRFSPSQMSKRHVAHRVDIPLARLVADRQVLD